MEKINLSSWLTGFYVTHSIATSLGGNNPYPNSPISLFGSEEDNEEKKINEEKLFDAYAAMHNRDFDKKAKKQEAI